MSRRITLVALALLSLSFSPLVAQDKKTKQAEKKLSEIMKEFDADLKAYEKELKHFQKATAAEPLLETHKELVEQAEKMTDLEKAGKGSGPAVLALANEMKTTSKKLDKETLKLEKHAKTAAGKGDQAAATQMRKNADSMIETIDKIVDMFD